MGTTTLAKKWRNLAAVALVIVVACGAIYYFAHGSLLSAGSKSSNADKSLRSQRLRVDVIHPIRGAMDRITVQPGSVQSYESADLFAEVPGYLKSQDVDIGAHVKRGQVLAVIDVPELEQQVTQHAAMLEQAQAKTKVAEAFVDTAKAQLEVAKATVTKVEAAAASAKATRSLREKQFRRYQELLASRSIEERLVDEKEEERDAAVEAASPSSPRKPISRPPRRAYDRHPPK